jgi:hypothetical protein
MTWILAQLTKQDAVIVAEVDYDADAEQVIIRSILDETVVVVNHNWNVFCSMLSLFGYDINYITNTIVFGDVMLDPYGEFSDFEIIFKDADWQIIPPLTWFDKIKLALYNAFPWCAAITF